MKGVFFFWLFNYFDFASLGNRTDQFPYAYAALLRLHLMPLQGRNFNFKIGWAGAHAAHIIAKICSLGSFLEILTFWLKGGN